MSETREFVGSVAVITGAGSGIGRATARAFAKQGAKLHIADVNAEAIAEVGAELEAAGTSTTTHVVDVSDPSAVEDFAARVYEADPVVDVLHNNAGIGHAGPTDDTTLEDWQRIIGVNLMGVIHGVHFFVPRMLAQGKASHIVNTASMAGLVAAPQMAPYCTSKFGVVGLSEALDAELGSRGIHVSAICPGVIDTAIVDTTTMRGEFAKSAGRVQRFYHTRGTSPDVVADAVLHAVKHKRIIQPTPRYQVTPAWMLKRISPRLSQFSSRLSLRFMTR